MHRYLLAFLLALGSLPAIAQAQNLIYRPVVGLAAIQGDPELAAQLTEQLVSRFESSPWVQLKSIQIPKYSINARPNTSKLNNVVLHYVVTAGIDKQADGKVAVTVFMWQMAYGPVTGRNMTVPANSFGDMSRVVARFIEQIAGEPKVSPGPDAADTFSELTISTIDTFDRKRGNSATYLGQAAAGKPNGLGRKATRDGEVIYGNWVNGNLDSGFTIVEIKNKGEVYLSFQSSSVSGLRVKVKRSQLDGPTGCNGEYPDWIVLTGRCTSRGVQPDPANGLMLLNRNSFDAYKTNGRDTAEYMMLRQGVMIRGKVRKPFDFVQGEVIVPWMAQDGIRERVEYSGPMDGLSMHGQGRCRSSDEGMAPCTMDQGRRLQ